MADRASRLPHDDKLTPVYLGEDWATQGDWVGRYGRQYAMLCAMNAPHADHSVAHGPFYSVTGQLGPHANPGDGLRHWVQSVATESSRCLYDPLIGIRRQAEWDDHGEAYPRAFEGPDIWIAVTVPAGLHRISLYFMSPDGHDGANRFRDYTVELRPYEADLRKAQLDRHLARARVAAFCGGVYKQFAVFEPGQYWLKIARNGSLNVMCSAITIDRLEGPSTILDTMNLPWMADVRYDPPQAPEAARREPFDHAWSQSIAPPARRTIRILAYRLGQAQAVDAALLSQWQWELCLWTPAERKEFQNVVARAWSQMQQFNPHLRSKQLRPYSPGTTEKEDDWVPSEQPPRAMN